MPMGAFVNKGLTMKSGQTHVHRYLKPLTDRIRKGDIDPSFVISHRLSERAERTPAAASAGGWPRAGRL